MGAAIAEFARAGMAEADVSAIVAAAGVAHGTFFFHFPTKEHVLLELERREEDRIAKQFAQFLKSSTISLPRWARRSASWPGWNAGWAIGSSMTFSRCISRRPVRRPRTAAITR